MGGTQISNGCRCVVDSDPLKDLNKNFIQIKKRFRQMHPFTSFSNLQMVYYNEHTLFYINYKQIIRQYSIYIVQSSNTSQQLVILILLERKTNKHIINTKQCFHAVVVQVQTNKQLNIFLNTETVQKLSIISVINNENNFAVFGFNQELQQIFCSVINISISFKTNTAALICFKCGIQVQDSVLVFIASGQILSSLILQSMSTIMIQNSSIQYRFNSVHSSALIFNASQTINVFNLSNTCILGFNNMSLSFQSHIISFTSVKINICVNNIFICSNFYNISEDSASIFLSAPLQFDCNLCPENYFVVYGICADQLNYSKISPQNHSLFCSDNFFFDGLQCVCKEYYILNGTECIDIIQILTEFQKQSESGIENKINALYQKIEQLDIDIQNNFTLQQNELFNNMQILENRIIGNVSKADQQLSDAVKQLEQYIISNKSILLSILKESETKLQKQINQSEASINQQLISYSTLYNDSLDILKNQLISINTSLSTNISSLNNSMQSQYVMLQNNLYQNSSNLELYIAENITLKDKQIQQLTQQLTQLSNVVMYTNEQELWFQCQQQLYTFKTYDNPQVTNIVTNQDFSNGFAFNGVTIFNALINVQSTSSNFTLFQNQVVFQNIKIQLGILTLGSGALLSQNNQLQINQLSIISDQITISSNEVFSVLQLTATQTNIQNLMLNLTCQSTSMGSLNLINQLQGKLNIKGYQILGNYSSSNTISLGVCYVESNSQIDVKYININPLSFTCGNLSSYLFSNVILCSILMNHINIQIGNDEYFNLISQISTNSTNPMQFGGIICNEMNTTAKFYDITINILEQWETSNINNSGSILGQAVQSQNLIQTLCFMEHLTSNSYFTYFGLVGLHNGTIYICNIQLHFMTILGNFKYFGTLGYINGSQCNIHNAQISLQVPVNNTGTYVGVLSSVILAENWSVTNITISNSYIYSKLLTGLIVSYINSGIFSQIYINSSIANSSGSYKWALSGGLYGDSRGVNYQNTSYNTTINQCFFQNNSIFTNSTDYQATSGGLIGDSQDNQISIQNVLLKFYNLSSYGSSYGIFRFNPQTSVGRFRALRFSIPQYFIKLLLIVGQGQLDILNIVTTSLTENEKYST
ncbi:Growth_factor receptor cysteine-rich domain superfamily [Hexamita inflata]|uniref:Growth_factor receptor cysteine-rich domain superfamily n=1 Tax=Hexamita inflata TaxID=28002 RepID=A0ABP1HC98_9EUKA